jgi:hypothetical protein
LQFGDALNSWTLLVMQAHELNDANRLTQAGAKLDIASSALDQLADERKKLGIEP